MFNESGKQDASQERPTGEIIEDCGQRLSVEDVRVRFVRNRLWAAKTRLEEARRYVMFSEVRVEVRAAQADLELALAYIGK